MIIEILADVFRGSDFKGVNTLIQTCSYENRYSLFVDLSKVIDTDFYKRLDKDDRDMLAQNFNVFMLSQSESDNESLGLFNAKYRVTYHSNSNTDFNIKEAIVFFSQKVSIILENNLNDSYFIQAIVNHLDSKGHVKFALEKDWIDFGHMGGCNNLNNYIKSMFRNYRNLPKDPQNYLRCFVLLDGDRKHPNLPINCNHKAVEELLKSLGIPYHITEKRSMENYMPDEVYQDFGNEEFSNARYYLSEHQKDFLNVQGGFTKKGANNIPIQSRNDLTEGVKEFYSDVSDANFNILDSGLAMPNFKSTYPLSFVESTKVNKSNLLRRTCEQQDPEELYNIINKIESLI